MSNRTPELTIENLLSLLIYEWQLTRGSPMGRPLGGVETRGNETSISLLPLTMSKKACPPNFGVFYDSAKFFDGMEKRSDAFLWYTRSRLYYSCSTVCVTFVEFIVPELKRRGIEELTVSSLLGSTKTVSLKNLKVKSIFFIPKEHKVHGFRFSYPFGENKLVVEESGSHNNLECSDTGMVFDPTLGQLSGLMKPTVFSSQESFQKEFVGEIMHCMDSTVNDIQEQKQRDMEEPSLTKNPACHPKHIAKRVVDLFLSECNGFQGNAKYCANCLGIAADGKKLLRCGMCKNIWYCSKACQILDWKCHKAQCQCK
jgi:hypothetical protein